MEKSRPANIRTTKQRHATFIVFFLLGTRKFIQITLRGIQMCRLVYSVDKYISASVIS